MSQSLLPVLEAVVNGLQAIDDRFGNDVEQGRLTITIERSGQEAFDFGSTAVGRAPLRPITAFVIEDNGVGFTDENMKSFETLDSEFKSHLGGRGVGRLLWLKAFDRVTIESTYDSEIGLLSRKFRFSVDHDVEHLDQPATLPTSGTRVELDGFKKDYQQNARKSGEVIARDIFEHCIWYFLRPGGAPDVFVVDDETYSLNAMVSDVVSSELPSSSVVVKGRQFDMVNLRLKASNFVPRLYWCAARRVVTDDNLSSGKVPGLHARLKDADGTEFTYVCYLSSRFLDDHVRADRMGFDFSERQAGSPLEDEPTAEDIRAAVLKQIEDVLAGPLQLAKDEGKARVNDYVTTRAPRYRPVLARMESRGFAPDPTLKENELELLLHRELRTIEDETLAEGQAVLGNISPQLSEDYTERLNEYLAATKEINQSDLAAYVARRKVILEILGKLIETNAEGEYSLEEAIHSLIMPMRTDSDELAPELPNLWIIDERLAFHEYLASDKPIRAMPITDSQSMKEPDLVALKNGPILVNEGTSPRLNSISVVEFKRPMRKDAKQGDDPIRQVLRYVQNIREGGVKTKAGRPIAGSLTIPAFCYVIADLTQSLREVCHDLDLIPTEDGMGFFGYNKSRNAYIEVMSFDRLLKGANERNRAFFDQLNLPTD